MQTTSKIYVRALKFRNNLNKLLRPVPKFSAKILAAGPVRFTRISTDRHSMKTISRPQLPATSQPRAGNCTPPDEGSHLNAKRKPLPSVQDLYSYFTSEPNTTPKPIGPDGNTDHTHVSRAVLRLILRRRTSPNTLRTGHAGPTPASNDCIQTFKS